VRYRYAPDLEFKRGVATEKLLRKPPMATHADSYVTIQRAAAAFVSGRESVEPCPVVASSPKYLQ
jgi:hypothetical protein